MKFSTDSIAIIGMSAAVPHHAIENMEPGSDDKKRAKLIKMTGIYRRHILDEKKMKLVDLAVIAASNVIEKTLVDKKNIKYIIYITQHPEFVGPATAFLVQKQLGIGTDCMVFDINLGCSGFVAGLQIASSMIAGMNDGSMALLINAELLSSVKRENANDEFLFGDAATATLIQKKSSMVKKYISDYYSDGSRYRAIFQEERDGACIMDGQAVFEFSVYEVSKYIKNFMIENNIMDEDVDHIAFHQAQKFIIDHIAVNAKLDRNKMLYSLDEYANTSGASVPLSICRNVEHLKEHGRYLLSGFGVGLAWGIAYIEIDKENVFGIVEV